MQTRRGWGGWLRAIFGGASGSPPGVDAGHAQQVIVVGDESRLAAAWRGQYGVAGGTQPGGPNLRSRILVVAGDNGADILLQAFGDNLGAGSFPSFWRLRAADAALDPATGFQCTVYDSLTRVGRLCRTRVFTDGLPSATFNASWPVDPIANNPDSPSSFQNPFVDQFLSRTPLHLGPGMMLEWVSEVDTIVQFTVWIDEPGSPEN